MGVAPGGGYDQLSRTVEPELEAALNVEVTVENLPGAGGLVAAHRLSRMTPDGRTLGILSGSGFMTLPYVSPEHSLDPERDFDVLARIGVGRPMLAVAARLGARTAEEVLRGREMLALGRGGPLSTSALMAPVLGAMFDVEMRLVSGYGGSVPMIAAAQRGDIDGVIVDAETVARASGLVPLLRLTRSEGVPGQPEMAPALIGSGSLIETHPELFRDPAKAREQASALEAVTAVGRIAAAPAGLPESLRVCLESAVFDAAVSPGAAERATRMRRVLAPLPAAETIRAIRAGREAAARLRPEIEDLHQVTGG